MGQSFLRLCHRLYNFIIKCLETYAMKSVTLGHGSHQAAAQLPPAISSSMTDQATHPMARETQVEDPVEDPSLHAEVEPSPEHKNVQDMADSRISSTPSKEEEDEEEAAAESAIAPEAQPPKKMVSINDTVEEMTAIWKKSKKSRKAEKVGSFDHEIEELSKPLKSILKVGSKQDENS